MKVGQESPSTSPADRAVQHHDVMWALFISLLGLMVTATIQAIVVAFSGSTALLADTIHNFADALTSIPLGLAFILSRKPPSRHFRYGLNRSEDIAGLAIILVIAVSALFTGYESYERMLHNQAPTHLLAVVAAAIVGFLGNEWVALYRIRMGKRMGSAALIADGHHAQIDGLTSLAVLIGAAGTYFGYPVLDPIVGLLITVMILFIVKDSAKMIFLRLLDGIEPALIEQVTETARQVPGVHTVTDVRARWFGHEIQMELSIAVDSAITVRDGHTIAKSVIQTLQREIPHVGSVQVHVDPVEENGAEFHLVSGVSGEIHVHP